MKKVLITGSTGYIGNALCYHLMIKDEENRLKVVTADTGFRKKWVKHCHGMSLTKYTDFPVDFHRDLTDYPSVRALLSDEKPDIIVHLASQPSAPYSELSPQKRVFTQFNNISMMQNLLYASHELGQSPYFIVTTTTGVPGAPDQPITESHLPNLAGSTYHISRGFDSANLYLAAKQFKFNILEFRTAIVYGTRIPSIKATVTRFDWDFYFGIMLHRFCLARMTRRLVTIYGKGEQRKPIISLADVVKSISNAIYSEPVKGHKIVNQCTDCLEVGLIAEVIGGRITHIPNPRVENETHKMEIINTEFLKILGSTPTDLKTEVEAICDDLIIDLLPHDWKDAYDGKLHIS